MEYLKQLKFSELIIIGQMKEGDRLSEQLGLRIKELRINKNWTLKELGQKSDLSAGYLSLVERNLTSINITSLQNIAAALAVDITAFFDPPNAPQSSVMRSHEQNVFFTEGSPDVYYSLASDLPASSLEPIIVQMLPEKESACLTPTTHEGEEFGYVLEGIITIHLDNKEYELFPGDSFHILSSTPHAVRNLSNRLARILYINTPKFFYPAQ